MAAPTDVLTRIDEIESELRGLSVELREIRTIVTQAAVAPAAAPASRITTPATVPAIPPVDPAARLDAAIGAGRFTLFQKVVQRFEPQGVTAVAVVGESHLAVHTWPEEGRLFLDIATCGDPSLADPAVAAFVSAVPNARVAKHETRVLDT